MDSAANYDCGQPVDATTGIPLLGLQMTALQPFGGYIVYLLDRTTLSRTVYSFGFGVESADDRMMIGVGELQIDSLYVLDRDVW